MSSFVDFLTGLSWLIIFVVFPILLGIAVCRALRVKEYAARSAFVLFTIFVALLPFARAIVQNEAHAYRTDANEWVSASKVKEITDPATQKPVPVEADSEKMLRDISLTGKDIKREGDKWVLAQNPDIEVVRRTTFDLSRWKDALSYGIDLAGGTNLVYELDESQRGSETIDNNLMERMVGAVTKRINPAGTKEIVVRRVGKMRIEVILPGADPAVVEETKELMTRLGTLEFSIVANERDHPEIIRAAKATPGTDVVMSGKIVAKWRPVAPIRDARGREVPNPQFDGNPEIAVRQWAGKPKGFEEILILYEPDESKQVTGKLLRRANPQRDSNGAPAVGFHFSQAGGYRFHELTSQNKPRKDGSKRLLAVLLNNEVHTAPSINQPISENGIIEGRFTEKEVEDLVSVLNAGALPVPIKKTPISEFTISPTLGYDVQSKGKLALWVSSLAVIIFMAGYYFVAGLVADFALLLNLLFIVAVMALVKAAFTLPGLAGLVLSAGMAVDANVLIYERMREETARGASLRMAIHNGFDKAFAAIFDSNIATLISSVILYMIGTEQVKGFAVSLIIGLAMNLYTAVFISRIIMNILERSRTIKKVHMLSLVGVTNIDFVGKQVIASIASIVLIVAGLVAFFARGVSNYDIDFTGGVSVTMQFTEPQDTGVVREKLEKAFDKNITVEELTPFGTTTKGQHFRLRVANKEEGDIDQKEVELKINDTFPGLLVKKSFTYDAPTAIKVLEPGQANADKAAAFAGGQNVHLQFKDDKGQAAEIAPATFSRFIQEKLESIKSSEGDGPKYPKADSLFDLVGTEGEGMRAREGKVKTFTAMTLYASAAVDPADLDVALADVQTMMDKTPLFDEVTSFASSVAKDTKSSAVYAVIAALLAIVAFVWFRFENLVFGLAAVVALAHDVLASLGCVALASYLSGTMIGSVLLFDDFKINMAMIAAFLTIVGYSLNDTIVIFDRLREIRGKNPVVTKDMINLTVNQCIGRTLLTAFTVFITVVILYVLGGEGIHGFAFCMVVGSIVGTYSTVYIASPLVLIFMRHAALSGGAGGGGRRPLTGPGATPAPAAR
jgi:SecD/SecF fusion protein